MDGECGVIDEKGNVVIPFGDLYEVDYDETYQGEEIKAMSAVAGKLYIVTEKTRDDLLNLHIFSDILLLFCLFLIILFLIYFVNAFFNFIII